MIPFGFYYSDCCNQTEESEDAYGHIVPVSQPFLKFDYMERQNEIKKDVICETCKKELFIYKESIVYPLLEMIPRHNTKDGLF